MSLAGDDSTTPLEMGGVDYAFKKLKRWNAEGPTERNKQMAQFILSHGSMSDGWHSHTLSAQALLLIDLAVEWGDFNMWQEVLKRGMSGGYPPQLSADVLIRACDVFTFDRTKHLFVHFILTSTPHSFAHVSLYLVCPAESRRLFAVTIPQGARLNL